jgi:hypothetical protein
MRKKSVWMENGWFLGVFGIKSGICGESKAFALGEPSVLHANISSHFPLS